MAQDGSSLNSSPPLTQQEYLSISSLCAAGKVMPLLAGVAAFYRTGMRIRPDSDPDPQHPAATQINADPDPKPCLKNPHNAR
jgi:hypothetical protein